MLTWCVPFPPPHPHPPSNNVLPGRQIQLSLDGASALRGQIRVTVDGVDVGVSTGVLQLSPTEVCACPAYGCGYAGCTSLTAAPTGSPTSAPAESQTDASSGRADDGTAAATMLVVMVVAVVLVIVVVVGAVLYVRSKVADDGVRPSGFENPLYGAGAGEGMYSDPSAFAAEPAAASGHMDVRPVQDEEDNTEDV